MAAGRPGSAHGALSAISTKHFVSWQPKLGGQVGVRMMAWHLYRASASANSVTAMA